MTMPTLTTSPILHVQGLSFAYPGAPALAADWSATVGAGVTLLHGDTGSGKSTLLRLLAGTLAPAVGRLTLAGVRLDADPAAYRRAVFWCEPACDAFDQVTARACADLLCGDASRFDASEWQMLVDGFALTPHLDKPMYMLSTGSKRKVWLAAALASAHTLTLLDEPTGALDAASVNCLMRALARFSAQRHPDRAIVVASADRLDRVPIAGVIALPLLQGA